LALGREDVARQLDAKTRQFRERHGERRRKRRIKQDRERARLQAPHALRKRGIGGCLR